MSTAQPGPQAKQLMDELRGRFISQEQALDDFVKGLNLMFNPFIAKSYYLAEKDVTDP